MRHRRRGQEENPDQLGLPLLDHQGHGAQDPVSLSWLNSHRLGWHEPVEEDRSDPPTQPAA